MIFFFPVTFEGIQCYVLVSNHQPCFTDTTPEPPTATGGGDAISGFSWMGKHPCSTRSVHPAATMCRRKLWPSLPCQGSLHLMQLFQLWERKEGQNRSINEALETKGSFFSWKARGKIRDHAQSGCMLIWFFYIPWLNSLAEFHPVNPWENNGARAARWHYTLCAAQSMFFKCTHRNKD